MEGGKIDAGKTGAVADGREQRRGRAIGDHDSARRGSGARPGSERDLIEVVHRDAVVHREEDRAGVAVTGRDQSGSSVGVPDSKFLIGRWLEVDIRLGREAVVVVESRGVEKRITAVGIAGRFGDVVNEGVGRDVVGTERLRGVEFHPHADETVVVDLRVGVGSGARAVRS